MQFHFPAVQYSHAMVDVVFIARLQQLQLITLFRALVAADTIGKMWLLLAIVAIMQRLINHLRN
jgi:hypothetical protein